MSLMCFMKVKCTYICCMLTWTRLLCFTWCTLFVFTAAENVRNAFKCCRVWCLLCTKTVVGKRSICLLIWCAKTLDPMDLYCTHYYCIVYLFISRLCYRWILNVTDRVTGCKIVWILIKLRLIGWVALHIRTMCIFWTCVFVCVELLTVVVVVIWEHCSAIVICWWHCSIVVTTKIIVDAKFEDKSSQMSRIRWNTETAYGRNNFFRRDLKADLKQWMFDRWEIVRMPCSGKAESCSFPWISRSSRIKTDLAT